MANKALDYMNPTCPDGAKWYACEATPTVTSPFIGCCRTDPCGVSGCNQGNIAPVSFNASAYDIMGAELREPSCDAGSSFHTCVKLPKNETTFWGCCKTDVCMTEDKVCKTGDLTMATIGDRDQQASYGLNGTSAGDDKEGGHSHTGVIVGAAVGGGVAVVAIIAILVFCLFKKWRARSRRGSGSSTTPANGFPGPEKTSYRNSALSESEAPSPYNSPKPPPFAAFSGQHQYQQVAQSSEPVEMPGDFIAGPTQRYSELPAEASREQAPVEMESPMISPYLSPKPSPRVPQTPVSPGRPRTGDATYGISMGNLRGSPRS